MKIRKNILPHTLADILCFLLIGVFMPIVFIFEMAVVLPAFHEPGGFFHTFTFLLASFILFNLKGNMIATMMIDTSVVGNTICSESTDIPVDWRNCEDCNKLVPPRSWHCKVCKTCILTRDHHCNFTGCCIGHNNHRYFILFIIYLFIGSTYAFVYNSLYIWVLNGHIYAKVVHVIQVLCPLLIIFNKTPLHSFFLMLYGLNILAMAISIALIVYHVPVVIRGGVSFERGKGYKYDCGWRENLRRVFGKRLHLVWLTPLVRSDLPNDGFNWQKSTCKKEN